jgi:hypothetical protein
MVPTVITTSTATIVITSYTVVLAGAAMPVELEFDLFDELTLEIEVEDAEEVFQSKNIPLSEADGSKQEC